MGMKMRKEAEMTNCGDKKDVLSSFAEMQQKKKKMNANNQTHRWKEKF